MAAADFAELELHFTQPVPGQFALAVRFRPAGSDADQVFPARTAAFDFDALREAANTFDDLGRPVYGSVLAGQVFPPGSPSLADFRTCMALAANTALRVQISTSPEAASLQGIVWEAMRDPLSGALLTTGERVWFSRYLSSQDPRVVQPRPLGKLRAVAAAASPSDLKADPIAVEEELERARSGMRGIDLRWLPDGGQRSTLDNLVRLLRSPTAERAEPVDVLYLVCHGRFVDGASTLFLEDEQGRTAPVAGEEFVTRLSEFIQLPRLVVLVSCESAGPETAVASGALAALGPLLAQAGVPAVLAMHGRVSMTTMARFLPVLFEEIQREGQIDRAVAVARGAVREAFDAWMPVLFLRSKSGRLWLQPSAGTTEDLFGDVLIQRNAQIADTFAHLNQFVDRVEAVTRFEQNVSVPLDQKSERLLAFVGPEGMGKNWLVDRLELECIRREVLAARLELEDDALNSPLAIMNALALELGGAPIARWLELYQVWRIGERAQSLDETPYAKNPQQAETVLSEAFLKALGELAETQPVVLLFDSLDTPNLPEPTRRWLIDTLLDKVRALGGHGVLPVVSLSEPPDYSDRRWARLEVHLYEHMLEAFDAGYIRMYLQQRALPEDVIESRLEECLSQTGGVPLRVAAFARALIRERRNARPAEGGSL